MCWLPPFATLRADALRGLGMALVIGSAAIGMSAVAQATSVPAITDILIPPNTIGLQPVSGRLKAIRTTSGNNTSLVLEYSLGTCVDQLLPITYTSQKQGGKLYVYISALNARGNAAAVSCAPGPYLTQRTLVVPGRYNSSNVKILHLTRRSDLNGLAK
jgi:hypothetical protein